MPTQVPRPQTNINATPEKEIETDEIVIEKDGEDVVSTTSTENDVAASLLDLACKDPCGETVHQSPAKSPAPHSQVKNIKGTNPTEQENNCNFTNQNSIKKWFPFYKNRGRCAVPMADLAVLSTNCSKAQYCRMWRDYTQAQQDEQIQTNKEKEKADREKYKQSLRLERSRKARERKQATEAK